MASLISVSKMLPVDPIGDGDPLIGRLGGVVGLVKGELLGMVGIADESPQVRDCALRIGAHQRLGDLEPESRSVICGSFNIGRGRG